MSDYYALLDEATRNQSVDDALPNITYWKSAKKETAEKENGRNR